MMTYVSDNRTRDDHIRDDHVRDDHISDDRVRSPTHVSAGLRPIGRTATAGVFDQCF
jgi:hypothetical protein